MLSKQVLPHDGSEDSPGTTVFGGVVVVVVGGRVLVGTVVEVVVGLVVEVVEVVEVVVALVIDVVEEVVGFVDRDVDKMVVGFVETLLLEFEAGSVQFPSWQLPYSQKAGPVPHFPSALQQSPQTPAHCL